VTSAGLEAVELCAAAGLLLDPWQQDVLIDSLGERQNGNWVAYEVCVVAPRQNGKGALIEARELAGLFLFGEQLIIHTAHLFATSLEAFRRVLYLIESNHEFDRLVKRVTRSHGEEGIELKTGQRLQFKARTRGSGKGLSGDVVILDEAQVLPAEALTALLPTLSAKANPQVWYVANAPLASSEMLRALCKRGRAGDSASLAFFEWCADRSAASDDREAWAQANPGLGIRLSESFTQTELESLSESEFRRDRLGIWFEEDVEQVIEPAVWRETADPRSRLADPVAFAIDVTPDRSSASIGVAGLRADGLRHLELVQRQQGTGWVVDRLLELVKRWETCAVALDSTSPAASLIPALERKGVRSSPDRDDTRLEIVGAGSMGQACGGWYDAVTNKQVRHLDQEPLNTALFGARRRDLGDGAWRWSRRDSTVDISPLVAVTLADHAFALHGERKRAVEPWFAFGYGEDE
jgi:hypothetical protein